MYLEDVFEDYKRYTDADEEYSSGEFSKKLRKNMEKYGLKDYLKLITPINKKEFKKKRNIHLVKKKKNFWDFFLVAQPQEKVRLPKSIPIK